MLHDDRLAGPGGRPLTPGQQAQLAREQLEALLHRGMDVGRNAAARLDPHLDDQRLVGVVGGPEGQPLPQDGVLHDLLLHVCLQD